MTIRIPPKKISISYLRSSDKIETTIRSKINFTFVGGIRSATDFNNRNGQLNTLFLLAEKLGHCSCINNNFAPVKNTRTGRKLTN